MGILPGGRIYWHAALVAITFSFVISLLIKNGAINGPAAPMKTVTNPLRPPNQTNAFSATGFPFFLRNKNHSI
jgi:hypothetical protein